MAKASAAANNRGEAELVSSATGALFYVEDKMACLHGAHVRVGVTVVGTSKDKKFVC